MVKIFDKENDDSITQIDIEKCDKKWLCILPIEVYRQRTKTDGEWKLLWEKIDKIYPKSFKNIQDGS